MDQYSAFELTELFYNRGSAIDTQFQYWMTFTFAVIVARFVAGSRLSSRLRAVAAILYAIATLVVLSRWYYAGIDAGAYAEKLRELGISISVPWITVFSRGTLMVLGSSAAVFFLLSKRLDEELDN